MLFILLNYEYRNEVTPESTYMVFSDFAISDLPIARKASLTRFLEKRKDRITARAPYASSETKPAESKSWLGLAAADSPVKLEQQ